MRVLVCGGREYSDKAALYAALDALHVLTPVTLVISGHAGKRIKHKGKPDTVIGADLLGEEWAKERGIPLGVYPADWLAHGKAAGPKRNQLMLTDGRPELVVSFPGGRGTADMTNRAKDANVRVVTINNRSGA